MSIFHICLHARLVWDPFACVTIQTLIGHSAAIQDVIINSQNNQIISLAVDKTIKVWDCRNFRCIQTLTDVESHRPENRFTSMLFDEKNNTLLAGTNRFVLFSRVNNSKGF